MGGRTLTKGTILLDGTGAPGQGGAIVNVSGTSVLTATSGWVAAERPLGEVRFASLAGDLTLNGDIDLNFSKLSVDGSGDISLSGAISGEGADMTFNNALRQQWFDRVTANGDVDNVGAGGGLAVSAATGENRLTGVLDFDNATQFQASTTGAPGSLVVTDNFAFLWSGTLTVPAGGTDYQFRIGGLSGGNDDRTNVFVDGVNVAQFPTSTGTTITGSMVSLAAGAHAFAVSFREGTGGEKTSVEVSIDGGLFLPLDPSLPALAGLFGTTYQADNSVTKSGTGTLTLSGTNTYTGTTAIDAGTLTVDGEIGNGGPASTVTIAANATLSGGGTVNADIFASSTLANIVASGDLVLGVAASANGYAMQGILSVGTHQVTLRDSGLALLGANTILAGGTLIAANGVSLAGGEAISGSGTVQADVATNSGSLNPG